MEKKSFFSIAVALVPVGEALPFSLYINVAAETSRDHFIRIFPEGGVLEKGEIDEFKKKYHQLYVSESQRSAYMNAVVRDTGKTDAEKTNFLKESAIHYLDNLFGEEKEISTEVLNQSISGCRDIVEKMVGVIQGYDIGRLQEMIAHLSFHDFYTYDHSINVSIYSVFIYRLLFPEASQVEVIQAGLGGMLHDLGKIKISTEIINKASPLTAEERKEIEHHPDYGFNFLKAPGVKLPEGVDPSVVIRVVHEHHENYDGTGYPRKISGEQIHVLARITAVADFFDAITTKRTYHDTLSVDEALALMKKSVGKKLDPKIFEIFAAQTRKIQESKTHLELPGDFDPCQPQVQFPFLKNQPVPHSGSNDLNPSQIRDQIKATLDKMSKGVAEQTGLNSLNAMLRECVSLMLKGVSPSPHLYEILSRIDINEGSYFSEHSIYLAEILCAIAAHLGWATEAIYSRLIMASFLHDMTLGNHPIAKCQSLKQAEERNQFSPEELEAFREHPQKASQLIRELLGTPSELESILEQHHEQMDGSGFPQKLTQRQLNPFSCLFILGQDLLDYCFTQGSDQRSNSRANHQANLQASQQTHPSPHSFGEALWKEWLKTRGPKYSTGSTRKILNQLESLFNSK